MELKTYASNALFRAHQWNGDNLQDFIDLELEAKEDEGLLTIASNEYSQGVSLKKGQFLVCNPNGNLCVWNEKEFGEFHRESSVYPSFQ